MEEAGDEPLFCERAAGTGIKQMIMVTIRIPGGTRRGGRQQEAREFGTTRRQLLELADWLRCWGVERAGMEAAGDYRKPVYFLLEREGLECLLYQASRVKALPGRPKAGKLDSVRLAKVTGRGSLSGSFVPPEDIRRLRACTRCRRRLTQARTAGKQRVEKLPEDARLKLSSVIGDVHGVSGRAVLDAVAGGERSARALARLARGTVRRRAAALEEALDCTFFTEEHAFVLSVMLAGTGHCTARIAVLDERTAALCGPWEHQVAQLDGIPGFGVTTARDLIAGTGVGMSAFPAAGHLCSWARLAPRVTGSGGKRKGKDAAGRGSPCTGAALGEAAVSAGRAQTCPGARYRRLCKRMPKKKAQVAVMRTQLVAARALLSDPEAACEDLGTGYYEQRSDARRRVRASIRSLERLGYQVTAPSTEATGEPAA